MSAWLLSWVRRFPMNRKQSSAVSARRQTSGSSYFLTVTRRPGKDRMPLSSIYATPDAMHSVSASDIQNALSRDFCGDWGTLDEHDRDANERALLHGERLFSVYHSEAGVKFYVITEWNRSVTTVLLP